MTANEPIKTVSDGITFLSTGRYYDGINRWVCHKIKEMDKDAINYAARNMAKLIPFSNAVLVPVPGHTGVSSNALLLANAIASYSDVLVADILRGKSRESNYLAKCKNHPLTESQMGFYSVKELPIDCVPIIIDNCVDTGTSAKAAYHALGNKGIVLAYAMSDRLLDDYSNSFRKALTL